MGIGGSGRMVR